MPPTRDADRAFDAWLRQGLSSQFAAALQEQVPDTLLSLLGQARNGADGHDALSRSESWSSGARTSRC